jgi:hypothetical protein
MIHDILKILDTTDLPELEKQRITTDLLRLFNVVGSCGKCGNKHKYTNSTICDSCLLNGII